MKKFCLFVALLLALSACRSADEKAAGALARRVMGPQARNIVFEQVSASEDSYELLQKGDKVLIRGNNANSIAPLIALMNINGCGETITSFEQAGEIFPNYNIPMGCSVQLVFFRNNSGSVLVKVLLNESEAQSKVKAAFF